VKDRGRPISTADFSPSLQEAPRTFRDVVPALTAGGPPCARRARRACCFQRIDVVV